MKRKKATVDKKLDRLWSKLVKERDKECQVCKDKSQPKINATTLQAHHIFSRRGRSTRWDLENGISLCSYHHNFATSPHISAHGEPKAFFRWLEETKGKRWVNALERRYHNMRKWTTFEKEELLETLKEL